MKRVVSASLAVFSLSVVSQSLWAHGPGIEVGTRVGFNVILPDDGSVVAFGIPGGAPAPLGTLFGTGSSIHAGFFLSNELMFEPQLNATIRSASNGADETILSITVASQVAYLFQGAAANSPYLGGSFSFNILDTDTIDSQSDVALGFGLGYRALPADNLAVRFEGAYRRWFDFDLNELTFGLILGVVL